MNYFTRVLSPAPSAGHAYDLTCTYACAGGADCPSADEVAAFVEGLGVVADCGAVPCSVKVLIVAEDVYDCLASFVSLRSAVLQSFPSITQWSCSYPWLHT